MTFFEAYSFLFADIFMEVVILPLHGQVALTAMNIFGGYNHFLMMILSVLAGIIGSSVNLFIGKLIRLAGKFNHEGDFPGKLLNIYNKYIVYILALIACVPFIGAAFVILSGFTKAKLKLVFGLIAFNAVWYYGLSTIILTK